MKSGRGEARAASRSTRPVAFRPITGLLAVVLAGLIFGAPAQAPAGVPADTVHTAKLPTDTVPTTLVPTTLVPTGDAPFPAAPDSRLHALLEKTIFQVNVLTLDIQVDPGTAGRLGALLEGRRDDDSDTLADAVARTVFIAPEVWMRMRFLHHASKKQLLNGIGKNMEKAVEAGFIGRDAFRRIEADLPRWYDFLDDRGVEPGDVMAYWARGDTLESTYRGADGTILLNMTQTGREHRDGVLGSYLAPGSEFRRNLVRSLLK